MNRVESLKQVFLISLFLSFYACSDFLNVIPDNIPTVDHAFNKRYQAEGFLYGCYSFLPDFAHPENNPAFFAGDEAWLFEESSMNRTMWYIAKGQQGTESPLANYWAGKQDSYGLNRGKALFTAISDCNIFLENIDKPLDLASWERTQWKAEAKCLKAFYHFWLLRMYGPIPILDVNKPISSNPEEVQVHREPIDDVVEYIVELLDNANEDLPLQIEDITHDLGRFTQPIAKALKAQVLTWAASPLFNGNPDYSNFVDSRGINLFSKEYNPIKWERAAAALKEAIDISHEAGHMLFDFATTNLTVHEKTAIAMQVRGAATERWNNEIIWGASNSNTERMEKVSIPAFSDVQKSGNILLSNAPTLRVVKQFYSKNGIPIEEDTEWEDIDIYEIIKGDEEHKMYIGEGFETIRLHFNREPRFYGAVTFDGGTFYGFGNISDQNMQVIKLRFGMAGRFRLNEHSSTGYLVKKNIHRLTALTETTSTPKYYRYAFPIIRLADLYLMYAEALNETKASPDEEVYEYIDLVRERTGLEGVVKSWQNYSNHPEKPRSKDGMRDIIQRERLNELAFEGIRFWDLRRWKLAEKYMNEPIQGFNVLEAEPEEFYKVQTLYTPEFTMKDYLWPLRTGNLLKNRNLIQNPGW